LFNAAGRPKDNSLSGNRRALTNTECPADNNEAETGISPFYSLDFKPGAKDSQMFKDMDQKIFERLEKEDITFNNHQYCIFDKKFEEYDLNESFTVLSTSDDRDGNAYISALEHKEYPIFGVQFHPEASRSKDTGQNQELMKAFIEHARQNNNSFPSPGGAADYLISNFNLTKSKYSFENTDHCNIPSHCLL